MNPFEQHHARRHGPPARVQLLIPPGARAQRRPPAPMRPQHGTVRPRVLQCLREHGPATVKQVMELTGMDYLQVANAIRALRSQEAVETCGVYPHTYRATDGRR